jgi:mycothiol synthase
MTTPQRAQLQMRWPLDRRDRPPTVDVPEGYRLRQLTTSDADLAQYERLMAGAGFEGWNPERTRGSLERALPGGYFVIEHVASGDLVATAFAKHSPSDESPSAGTLEYVAGDPRHAGKGLGRAVCAAVLDHLLHRGYVAISLKTDDARLPALATYLKQGWEPVIDSGEMATRWEAIRKTLRSE